MAKADAWGAPGGSVFVRRRAGAERRSAGHARIIAEPAYRRLLAAEPLLRRSIPTLIVIFLVVVAAVRVLSLLDWHDDIERNAKAMLALAAGELVNALMLTAEESAGAPAAASRDAACSGPVEHGGMGRRYRAGRHRRRLQGRRRFAAAPSPGRASRSTT